MELMEKRHWHAALAAMMLCGLAMPVMAETDTPVVVSTADTDVYKRQLLPKPLLEELHEGLIYGSACVVGEFFEAVLEGKSDEELMKIAQFYDYLEVQPVGNNSFLINDDKHPDITSIEDLQNLNRKVVEIGEKTGIPVCACLLYTSRCV